MLLLETLLAVKALKRLGLVALSAASSCRMERGWSFCQASKNSQSYDMMCDNFGDCYTFLVLIKVIVRLVWDQVCISDSLQCFWFTVNHHIIIMLRGFLTNWIQILLVSKQRTSIPAWHYYWTPENLLPFKAFQILDLVASLFFCHKSSS